MHKYSIEINDLMTISKAKSRLLSKVKKEWEVVREKNDSYEQYSIFEEGKNISYFVKKNNVLFFCGPINVRISHLTDCLQWIFDYVYFANGEIVIQKDLSYTYRSDFDDKIDPRIISKPAVIAKNDNGFCFLRARDVYDFEAMSTVFVVNRMLVDDNLNKYDLTIYKNSHVIKNANNLLYINMSISEPTKISFSSKSFYSLLVEGGSVSTYDLENGVEFTEEKRGTNEKYNYLKIDRTIYNYVPVNRFYESTSQDEFRKDVKRYKELIKKFGYSDALDMEICFVEGAYSYWVDICNFLEWLYKKRESSIFNNKCDRYVFRMKRKYDKYYYCVVKLAEYAVEIKECGDGYELSFDGKNVEHMELMYCLITEHGKWDSRKDEEKKIINYLIENSYNMLVKFAVSEFTHNMCAHTIEYSNVLPGIYVDILHKMVKDVNEKLKLKIDNIYKEMLDENRVNIKWSNEYLLYRMIASMVENVEYQYRCNWLGNQSFDIFLNGYNIAVEYQGKQHYEPVEFFGGEEAYERNVERDIRKHMLAKKNGVNILYWNYYDEITEESVREFLVKNHISIRNDRKESVIHYNEMDTIIEVKKEKSTVNRNVKETKWWYIQYSMQGNLVNKYESLLSASQAVGVSATSIAKAIRGERKSAGMYVWKKISAKDEIPDTIEIDFNIQETNPGRAKKVFKLDEKGNVLEEYTSLQKAARDNNTQVKTIKRRALSKQGWYIEEN